MRCVTCNKPLQPHTGRGQRRRTCDESCRCKARRLARRFNPIVAMVLDALEGRDLTESSPEGRVLVDEAVSRQLAERGLAIHVRGGAARKRVVA